MYTIGDARRESAFNDMNEGRRGPKRKPAWRTENRTLDSINHNHYNLITNSEYHFRSESTPAAAPRVK